MSSRRPAAMSTVVFSRIKPAPQANQYESIWDIEPGATGGATSLNRGPEAVCDNIATGNAAPPNRGSVTLRADMATGQNVAGPTRDLPSNPMPPIPAPRSRQPVPNEPRTQNQGTCKNNQPYVKQMPPKRSNDRPNPYPTNQRRNEGKAPPKETMKEKAARLTSIPNTSNTDTDDGPIDYTYSNVDGKRSGNGNENPMTSNPLETVAEESVTICESNISTQNDPTENEKSWADELSDEEFASLVESVEESHIPANVPPPVTNTKPNHNAPKQQRNNRQPTSTPVNRNRQSEPSRNEPQFRYNNGRSDNTNNRGKPEPRYQLRNPRSNPENKNRTRDDTSYASVASKNQWLPAVPYKRKRVKSGSRTIPLRSAKSIPLREIYVEGLAYSGYDSYGDIENSIYQYCMERDIKLVHAITIPIRLNKAQVGCKITCNEMDCECLLDEEFWPEDIFARPWRQNNKSDNDRDDGSSDREEN